MKAEKINLLAKFEHVMDYWSPRIIEQMNDYHFKLAKFKGEFTCHDHKETDEVFFVVEGEMKIEFRDRTVTLKSGELFVVPKGVEHKPVSEEECKVMLIEPAGTVNTGEVENDQTVAEIDWI